MTVREICDRLQILANNGFAVHSVEIQSECEKCSEDIILDNPELLILEDDENKSIRLLFR